MDKDISLTIEIKAPVDGVRETDAQWTDDLSLNDELVLAFAAIDAAVELVKDAIIKKGDEPNPSRIEHVIAGFGIEACARRFDNTAKYSYDTFEDAKH